MRLHASLSQRLSMKVTVGFHFALSEEDECEALVLTSSACKARRIDVQHRNILVRLYTSRVNAYRANCPCLKIDIHDREKMQRANAMRLLKGL